MIYDSLVDLLKLLFGTIEFLKPYAAPAGIFFLILRQHNIRKMINGKLPKRFRDTQSNDIYDIMRDIKSIKMHLEVPDWNVSQLNGQETIRIPLYRRFFLFLQAVTNQKRRMIMNKLKSRKFWMAILAVVLPVINEQFNLGLDTTTVVAAIGGIVAFILGEAHVDAKKAGDTIAPTNTDSTK